MPTEETVKLNVGIQVSYIANSTREDVVDTGIPRSEWNAMSEQERQTILNGYVETEIANTVSAWAESVEDDE